MVKGAWETNQGRRLSKNQARQVIEQQRLSMIHAHSYLSELSLSDLRALVAAVEQVLAALDLNKTVLFLRKKEPGSDLLMTC